MRRATSVLAAAVLAAMPVVGVLAMAADADVIRLRDGEVMEGDLRRTETGWEVVTPAGNRLEVPAEQVHRVELKAPTGEGPAGQGLALRRLESLRDSVKASADLPWIIGRYEQFIGQYRDSFAAEKATAELDVWRQRAEQGLVRLGDQWVSPQRKTELQIEATNQAAEGRHLIKSGQAVDNAGRLIEQALKTDPQNVTALYLRGLLALQDGELGPARRALETAHAQLKDHPATLNNLAVIAWRQNRYTDALALYDQAMTAAPADEAVLYNAAEALNALPKDMQSHPVAQRAHRRFIDTDRKLQEAQQAAGKYRWGSQYVTKEEYDALRTKEQEINQRLDGLAAQFDDVEADLAMFDQQLSSNERLLRQMEASSYARSWDGFLIRAPLPSVYYEIIRDNEEIRRDRAGAVAQLDRLRAQARQVQAQLPRPKFTGVQNPIGVEGTPLGTALAGGAAVPVEPNPAREQQQPVAEPEPAAAVVAQADAGGAVVTVTVGPPREPTTQPVERVTR